MLFGLANALSLFQHFINNALRPYLDIFCTVYIDDILIYSDNLTKYQKHINLILEALCRASLQLDINKCEFYKIETLYFKLIIFINGVQMDPKKIKIIINWQELKNIKDIRAFIEFTNFY